jgi:transposase
MFVHTVPNRNSPPAVLLREGYRQDGKIKMRTIANLSKWAPERIEALKRCLKGEFDGIVGELGPTTGRTFGTLFVLAQMADRLEITRALGRTRFGKLALFLVLARVSDQRSRLSAVRWAKDHCVAEILGLDAFDEKELYSTLDWVAKHQDKIEKKLFKAHARKKGAPNVLVLYDVTSCYLEGECNELGAFGYPHDNIKGKKQIVVGLLTDAEGEPLSIRVFEGNTADPSTVSTQIETLKKRFGVTDVVFVGDRGMIKSKGKAALSESGLKYITALTTPQVRKLIRKGIIQLGLFEQTVTEVQTGGLRLVLRRNELVRRKEQRRREDKLARLRHLVDERNAFVEEAPRAKPEAGKRKFTAWARRHKLSSFCTIELQERKLKVNIDAEKMAEAALLDGCYVMETDVSAEMMDAKTVDDRYRSLQKVERNFRTLKNGFLEIRPIYLQKAARTQGHALICMLALKIVNEATRLLKENLPSGLADGQDRCLLDTALRTMGRLTLDRYNVNGIEFLRLPNPDENQIAVCKALGIPQITHRSQAVC